MNGRQRTAMALSEARRKCASGEARDLRVSAAHLTLEQMATLADVSVASVWRWENGTRRCSGRAGVRYGHALDDLALEVRR